MSNIKRKKKINLLCLISCGIIMFIFSNCNYANPKKINYCKEEVYLLEEVNGDSIFKIIDEKNSTYMIGKIKNCNREGIWHEYLIEDNNLSYKWTYKNDLRNGIYFNYTITGKVQSIGYYKNDQLDGVLVFFDLKNKLEKFQYWRSADGFSELVFTKDL